MRVLVTGAAGQLGRAVVRRFTDRHEVIAATAADLDVRDHRAVSALVTDRRPDAVVNCAAFTDVDGAEDDPVEALRVNAFAVRALAAASRRVDAVLVHYSTDFVFDGGATAPYEEDRAANPRSSYACSKLLGEWLAEGAGRYYVLRVESLFGAPAAEAGARRTSVDRIVDTILAGHEAEVFTDRTVSPSYTVDVAAATEAILEGRIAYGLYHCVNTGCGTWFDLGRTVCELLGVPPRLRPITVTERPGKAERPRYCALSNAKLRRSGVAMPTWQDALARYLASRCVPA